MIQFGGKDSKRHFTVVMEGKEHGLYVSSTPSSAAKKAVTKLCASNKSKKVEFSIREITQGSKKKTYGPYTGYIEKLKEPIELKGRVIRYKPVAKLSGKAAKKMKGGEPKPTGAAKAGPAPVKSNRLEKQIAFISLNIPEKKNKNFDEFQKIIRRLEDLDESIFHASIFQGEDNTLFITINSINYLEAKEQRNYEKNLAGLIEVLAYFKKARDQKLFDTTFHLFDPNDEIFNDDYNFFLKLLANTIEPTVNQNRKLQHVHAPRLPNNFPQGSAPPLNSNNE
jgi:hypothetical protein